MKKSALLAAVLVLPVSAGANHAHRAPPARSAAAISGLSALSHPVSTANREAQRFFDQGLRLVFAFNHDEAVRAFRRAAELDPNLAMAHWGVALANGPNINLPMDAEHGARAYESVQRARALAPKASQPERDYITALAARYAADPKAERGPLDRAYRDAMRALMRKYPDDLDAATLYAEAIMDLRPWQYWTAEGKPNEDTEELVAILESVLRRDPDHLGANHYYIHAVEASPKPERALGAARRLEDLAPAAGHLVHMPTHIYARLGDHETSARINDKAAAVDRDYIRRHAVTGIYPAMYFNHNLHFAAYSHAAAGRYADALRAAREVTSSSTPMVKEMPMAELFTPTELLVQIRFRRWKDILAMREPPAHMPITRALWRFARGMAHAGLDQREEAAMELKALRDARDAVPAEATIGFSPARAVLAVAAQQLEARIAGARGDLSRESELLREAAAAEDALPYDEPPDWYLHARESLGGALLRAGRAAEAEKVFRKELDLHPRSGRSLFGLAAALEAQGDAHGAGLVRAEFKKAWKSADVTLRVEDL